MKFFFTCRVEGHIYSIPQAETSSGQPAHHVQNMYNNVPGVNSGG